MAQSLLGVLTGVQVVDGQSVALHPISELQHNATEAGTVSSVVSDENTPFDEEDVFQCGKCKKQFYSMTSFLTHKKEHCINRHNPNGLPSISPSLSSSPRGAGTSILHFPHSSSNLVRPVHIATSFETFSSVPQNVICDAEFLSVNGMESPAIAIPIHSLRSSETYVTSMSSSPVSVTSPIVGTISTINPVAVPLQSVSLAGSINASSLLTVKALPPSSFSKETSSDRNVVMDQNVDALIVGNERLCEEVKLAAEGEILKYDLVIKFQNGERSNEETPTIDGNVLPVDSVSAPDVESKVKKRFKSLNSKSDAQGRKLGKLQCNYCGKGFSKKFDLDQHVRSHTGEKPFQCLVCGRAFAQRSNVKKHMQTHKVWPVEISHTVSNKRNGDEDLPKENSDSFRECQKGEKPEIVIDPSYICQFCNQTFPVYGQLKTHLKLHKNEQVYKCILKSCGEVFKDLDTYLEHTRSHEKEMNYRCHVCSKIFTSLSELAFHQYYHEAEVQKQSTNKKIFTCNTCQNKYSTLNALEHHRSTCSHHFPCSYCGKVYHSERFLRRHILTHNTTSSHKCETCGKYFKTEHYLKLHRLIHSGDKPFQCLQCTASFNRKDKLKRHLLIHDPVKRYKCPFKPHTGCTKEFHRQDKLKAHILTHSGIKPYQCFHCKRTFSRYSTLKVHVKQVLHETGVIVCTYCRKDFLCESRWLEHKCANEEIKGLKRQISTSHSRYSRFHCGRRNTNISPSKKEAIKKIKDAMTTALKDDVDDCGQLVGQIIERQNNGESIAVGGQTIQRL
ncbi:hypothetical protein CHUAL_012312 [Chamberlinius hualienensis]